MPFDNIYSEKKVPSVLRQTWTHFHQDTLAMIGLYGVSALILLCFLGRYLAPYGFDQQFFGLQLLPPSWAHDGNISFFFGTDDLGRDLLSRVLCGIAPTFGSAIIVTIIAMLIGIIIGIFAGISRGLRSAILNHILDTLLAIPSLLLAIVVVAFIGPRLSHAMLAVTLALLPSIVRAVHTAVHNELEKEYIEAARLDGASTRFLLWDAILPNIHGTLILELTRSLSLAILEIALLGFLDLGAQRPSSEWGAMLSDSLELLYVSPWTVMLPGAAIMLCVLLVNLLGDGLRRALNAGVEYATA